VPMTPPQRDLHTENKEVVARIVLKWRKYKFLSEADQRRLMIALQRMRMVCDSTYLLEPATDHGNKVNEIVTLLDELLERAGTKVVVFSQWLRMHELLVKRLKDRECDHVLFHGGVPGPKRKELVDRFRDRPECRAFLATDAGGVGLNLQFASVVLNVDLPWNPAVLEQRVGRVHRLGQEQPVRVVNFVAQGTIEEGMLGVLKFKKSLFAGVLDGGEKEVFLGGTRLGKFMESVEAATTAIPPGDPEAEAEPAPAPRAAGPGSGEDAPTAQPAAPPPAAQVASPWAALLQAGASLLQQLTAPPAGNGHAPRPFVQRDERTGEEYVRLPVPPPEVIDQALAALQQFLGRLRG
jgi:Helicase conserved C-terminal domain